MNVEQQLLSDLQKLGVRPGGVLLVHSSLRSLGSFPNRAETVIRALQEAVGEHGALLMPALSYGMVTIDKPYFDLERTPSCVGALTEVFRKQPDVLRSEHPTHSVCGWGRRAAELLGSQHLDTTPCGRHSPFYKLREAGGQILFLGCGLRPNTSMHAVEELVDPVYLLAGYVDYHLRLADGRKEIRSLRRHNFLGWEQRYDRLKQLLSGDELRRGKVLAAECYLVEAIAMWEKALASLKKNPLFFVDCV